MNYKTFWKNNNPPFLILHWWGGSSDSWEEVGKKLWEKFFVIVPDIPCASKKETRWEKQMRPDEKISSCDKVYTIDDYADLIKDFIDELWLKDFILLWHSNGWAVATKLVVKYSDLSVKKLILNNSAWIRKDTKRTLKRKIFWVISKMIKPIFSFPWMWKVRILFYKAIWWHDYLEAEKNPNKKQTYLNMINSDLQEVFPKIDKDTLLIWGENDTYTPLSDGRKIHKLIKNSKLVIIKDVRHGIHLQKPDELVKVILENV